MIFFKTLKSLAGSSALALTTLGVASPAFAVDELTVGYFLEWPMPFLAAKADGKYAEALGMPVNWVSFDTGTAMSAAMASGDVQLSVSQGVPPFVIATSSGQALQMLDVAVSYAENDNCVVAAELEIDKDSADELAGKKVAVPLGTGAHYGFLKQMEHFGVDLASLEIIDMAPTDGAAALAQGSVDFACGWGGALSRMKEHGNILLTGTEKEDIGILVFDVTSGPSDFVVENEEIVSKFLAVTAEYNAAWMADQPADMLTKVAVEAGMDEDAAAASMATFNFPSVEDQFSEKWLGGAAQAYMKGVADVFVEAESIPSALESYDDTVSTGPLAAIK